MKSSAKKSNFFSHLLRLILYCTSFLILGHSVTFNSSLNSKKDSLLNNNNNQIPAFISIVSINSSYMYISDGSNRISIVSSDNQNINGEMGFIEIIGSVKDIIARNKKLYVLTNSSLEIFNVSNPIKSILLKRHVFEDPVGLDISLTDIYIVTKDKLIQIDANAPFEIYDNSKGPNLDDPLDIVVIEKNAYISVPNGVQVIDISDPSIQINLGQYSSMKEALDAHHESLHYEYNDRTSIAPLLNPENLAHFSTFAVFESDDEALMNNKFNYFYSKEDVVVINSTDYLKDDSSEVTDNNYGPIKDENNELTAELSSNQMVKKGIVVFSELDESGNLIINKGSESKDNW